MVPKYACPVCGDPNAFPIWIDDVPPATCADDPAWPRRSLNSICNRQLARARQAAELRRVAPDCFDASGVMIPGRSGDAWRAYMDAHPDKEILV